MEPAQYIAKLDALVAVIQPGIFVFAIILLAAEAIILVRSNIAINHKGGAVSYLSGAFVFGLEALADFLFYLSVSYWLYNHRLFDSGFAWYMWFICFLLYDLMFYISHRIQHQVRLLWCFHAAHHSTPEMRLSSAIRGSMFDFIYTPPFFIWMCLFGIHPLMFIVVRTLSRVWGILEHVNEKFVGRTTWLGKIFITPDIHRVHHGKNYIYLDRNYSEILAIWDRLFGTYQPYTEKPEYGILRDMNTDSFIDVQFGSLHDLWKDVKATRSIKNKIKLLYMPPGWYPDGRDMRAATLRKLAAPVNT